MINKDEAVLITIKGPEDFSSSTACEAFVCVSAERDDRSHSISGIQAVMPIARCDATISLYAGIVSAAETIAATYPLAPFLLDIARANHRPFVELATELIALLNKPVAKPIQKGSTEFANKSGYSDATYNAEIIAIPMLSSAVLFMFDDRSKVTQADLDILQDVFYAWFNIVGAADVHSNPRWALDLLLMKPTLTKIKEYLLEGATDEVMQPIDCYDMETTKETVDMLLNSNDLLQKACVNVISEVSGLPKLIVNGMMEARR